MSKTAAFGKDLVIVESPAKARTITAILGDGYNVMASMGHVRDLPEKALGVDIKHDFKPVYRRTPTRKKVIDALAAAIKTARNVYLATDPDREGEAIAWHLYELLKSANTKARFQRVVFHEITKPAVQASFRSPGELDMNLVNAQQARRVLDRLVGYQVSPLLWAKVEPGTSAGRVQSVALRLICERQEAIDKFESKEYWVLTGQFETEAKSEKFKAKLAKINGRKAEVPSADLAAQYTNDAGKAAYYVADVKKTPKQRWAQPPFITSTLQQAASANLHFSPNQSMRLAQQLYEGVNIGTDHAGLITYMRTDSVKVSKLAQEGARDFIRQEYGPQFVPAKPNRYKSKASAQEAHEAIRPTDVTLIPDKAKAFLDEEQHKLYTLIWNRFVASQMAPAKLLQHSVEINSRPDSARHAYVFRAVSTEVVFPGYTQVYNLQDVTDEKKKDGETKLPELKVDEACRLLKLDKEQKFTEPPPRFSEAMLIRELESNGVGRPSTYASIVNTIKKRAYVAKEKGKLYPSELGKSVNLFLLSNLPHLFEVDFTARMETSLDLVERGKEEWVSMLKQFYGDFSEWLDTANARTSVPSEAVVKEVLALFPKTFKWAKPEERAGRTYDDQSFFGSLRSQVLGGKQLSEKQWLALVTLITRYEGQLPTLRETVERLGLTNVFAAAAERLTAQAQQKPDESVLELCALLDQVHAWEKPTGPRGKNDLRFYSSLKEQAQKKPLSERQVYALKNLLKKYHQQIPDYDQLQEKLGLFPPLESGSANRLQEMTAMLGEIKKWDKPVKSGAKTYNDKAFAASLTRQFAERGSLSSKQVAAIGRLLAKYQDQVSDFEERREKLNLKISAADPRGEETDMTCPDCKSAKLVKKRSRGKTFYGCAAYPECRFTASSLKKLRNL